MLWESTAIRDTPEPDPSTWEIRWPLDPSAEGELQSYRFPFADYPRERFPDELHVAPHAFGGYHSGYGLDGVVGPDGDFHAVEADGLIYDRIPAGIPVP